jgi:DNA-binding SARP family transcriptional activator
MSPVTSRYLCERRDQPSVSRPSNLHAGLVARSRELSHIDQLLWQARRGKSGAIGLRGESGVGKSALIEAAVARATEFRTVQVRGRVPGDAAALLPQWPQPLSEVASRLDGAPPALPRFLAVDEATATPVPAPPAASVVEAAAGAFRRMLDAAGGPLLVTVDDCQTLPPGLVEAMAAAVLSHLGDESISLVLAWRDVPHLEPFQLVHALVPQHRLGGLTVPQAEQLLASRFESPPSGPVLADLVARSGGNPLVLVDVCGRLTPAQLAGWHPLPDPLPVTGESAEGFDVIRHMPPPTRRALAVVAAGGASRQVMLDAMGRLGVGAADLMPAIEAGIIYERGPRIGFRHPLVRSVAFHRAPPEVRQAVRGALSDVLAEAEAIEASAYHASVDVVAPDELAARRLVAAARVALDRGDPAAAARHEELAARCSPATDAAGQHLADAAAHWLSAGERERAHYCVDSAGDLDMSRPVAAEVAYQRARLAADAHESAAAAQMVTAAEACIDERPHRALAMLVDAAAWRILANRPADAEAIAERAVRVAGAVSSHSEVLARAVRAAAVLARGGTIDEIAERSHVSLLIGQIERFPSSAEVAVVIGRSLCQQGLRRQADRWAQWIERCAERSGDRTLAVVPPFLAGSNHLDDGRLDEAARAVLAGAAAAERTGSVAMAAWGWHLATQVHALVGDYEQGLRASAQLFALADHIGGLARLRALPALGLLELQRGRASAAVAWARTAQEEILHDCAGSGAAPGTVVADVVPVIATVLFLARQPSDAGQWAALLGDEDDLRTAPMACRAWLHGLWAGDAAAAVEDLVVAGAGYHDEPFRRALIDLCLAVRLADAGRTAQAADRLDDVERRMRAADADGLVELVARERRLLPVPPPDAAAAAPPAATAAPTTRRRVEGAPPGEWEISLLGAFTIRHKGTLVSLPASLAAQAVKVVTLRPRITVDELIELLWEDAEPGVGARRLRNVLWRIRSACGDLLVREGSFVRLAPGAVSDVSRFRSLAERALVGADAGTPQAVETARQALAYYRGELLPGDRYADWAAAARESVARTHLRLLDLLVDDALAGDREAEALVLLDRLAEVDPYDERHHLRTAEIHLRAGNRGRTLDALERAERMLTDLRVSPSAAVRRLRESLDRP